jgi:hypothetical protein
MRRQKTVPFFICLGISTLAAAQEIKAPAQVSAGTSFSITSGQSGKATVYLIGPYSVSKRAVASAANVSVEASEVEHAGRYTLVICSDRCAATHFYVRPADGSRLSLLVHPSRVPVGDANAISAVAFVTDRFHSLKLAPESVEFQVIPKTGNPLSERRPVQNGVAWVRLSSGSKEGPVKIGVSSGKISEIRVVQQVAADACNLRIKPAWNNGKFFVETDPVRDCSGNSVPDGTIVSFLKTDSNGKATVDVPIKKGIAKVEMSIAGNAHITVASGVVTGNELNVSGHS